MSAPYQLYSRGAGGSVLLCIVASISEAESFSELRPDVVARNREGFELDLMPRAPKVKPLPKRRRDLTKRRKGTAPTAEVAAS